MDNRKETTKQLSIQHAGKDVIIKERNGSNNQVKLCGYLRKKRNKIGGGWRKMWFVLQDKLLLSYSSKEEYDNKLVSFKDVLNLVPGTKVHALEGCRFTIETTTQVVYTFHCDGYPVYREWITTLLDSIATYPVQAPLAGASAPLASRCFNYSMDSIPHALGILGQAAARMRRPSDNLTNSCDSIGAHVERSAARHWMAMDGPGGGVGGGGGGGGYVRLPIAQTTCTAKILERNGVHSTGSRCPLRPQAAPNGRRKMQQQQQQAAPNNGVNEMRLIMQHDDLESRTEMSLLWGESRDPLLSEMATRKFLSERLAEGGGVGPKGCAARQTPTPDKGYLQQKTLTEITSCHTDPCKSLAVVKDRIQRLSLKGYRDSAMVDSLLTPAGERGVDRRKHSMLMTTASREEQQQPPFVPSLLNDPSGNEYRMSNNNSSNNNYNNNNLEPIYAVIDLNNKYAQRKLRNAAAQTREADLKRCNSYDSIVHKTSSRYEMNRKSLSLNEDDIDAIYEDGDKFLVTSIYMPLRYGNTANGHSSNSKDDEEEEDQNGDLEGEENIYEPINVRSQPSVHAAQMPFWKYFTRLKVNSLLHLTRKTSRAAEGNSPEAVEPPLPLGGVKTPAAKFPAHFTSIKHKFGIHRRSMQMRMRKLCTKDYEPKPFVKAVPMPKVKIQWRPMKFAAKPNPKVDMVKGAGSGVGAGGVLSEKKRRHIFGSLPHLKRKSRVSLLDVSKLREDARRGGAEYAGAEESGSEEPTTPGAEDGGRGSCCSSGSNFSENSLDYKEQSMRISMNGNQEDIDV